MNERAQQRARDLEARGLVALGESDEVRTSKHRSARGLAGAARGMLAQADDNHIIAGLDKIAVPTLVLVGANDTHFLAAADYMTRKIPSATRVTVADAGHASNLHPAGRLQPRGPRLSRRTAGQGVTADAGICFAQLQSSVVSACCRHLLLQAEIRLTRLLVDSLQP